MTHSALARVDATHPALLALIAQLDEELRERYGALQDEYAPFNGLGDLPTCLLLSDATAFVACGCIRPIDANAIELKRMFVRPDRRGRGFAGEIIGGLEAWAIELGYTTMLLETGDRQPEAVALYAKHGFVRIAPYGPYAELPATSICMSKPLRA